MKTFWKILMGLFLFLLIGVFVGSWYLSKHWKPILNERLQILVASSSDSLYHLTYDELDFSWHGGNAYLTNVHLKADARVYEKLKAENRAPDNRYNVHISSIKLKNFHPKKLYQQRKLNIDELLIEEASVEVISEDIPQDSVPVTVKKTPYQQISKYLSELRINQLKIADLSYSMENRSDSVARKTHLKNINIEIQDFLIDSLSQQDSSRLYYTQGIHFKMDQYQIATRDSLYYLTLKNIDFSTKDKSLAIGRIELQPRKNKKEFFLTTKKPGDRVDLAFDSLLLQNIDIAGLIKSQRFQASRLDIKKGYVEIYHDANYGNKKTNKGIKDPHEQLRDYARNLRIDTILISKTDIAYEERSKISQQSGRISFRQSELRFLNVTNDSAAIQQNHLLKVDISSRFMNVAALQARFTFDLGSPTGDFQYQGKLDNLNGRHLNTVLKPLAQVEVQSVNVRSLAFNFKATKASTVGVVDFRYNNLKVNLLKVGQDGSVSSNKMVSDIANSFILNPSNPSESGEFLKGRVRMRRPADYSFFKLVWKSIFQGVKTSAGVNEEREAQLKNTAQGAKKAVDKTKETAKKVGTFLKGVFNKKEKKEK